MSGSESAQPLHDRYISLERGLSFRESEDLIVEGPPRLVLRRTYQSGYRISKEFGSVTTHSAGWYLVGDGKQFAWARNGGTLT